MNKRRWICSQEKETGGRRGRIWGGRQTKQQSLLHGEVNGLELGLRKDLMGECGIHCENQESVGGGGGYFSPRSMLEWRQ